MEFEIGNVRADFPATNMIWYVAQKMRCLVSGWFWCTTLKFYRPMSWMSRYFVGRHSRCQIGKDTFIFLVSVYLNQGKFCSWLLLLENFKQFCRRIDIDLCTHPISIAVATASGLVGSRSICVYWLIFFWVLFSDFCKYTNIQFIYFQRNFCS